MLLTVYISVWRQNRNCFLNKENTVTRTDYMIRNGLHNHTKGMDERKKKLENIIDRTKHYYPFSYNTLFDWDNDFRTRIYRMPFITRHEALITMRSQKEKGYRWSNNFSSPLYLSIMKLCLHMASVLFIGVF